MEDRMKMLPVEEFDKAAHLLYQKRTSPSIKIY
jgi:hypothetical protein